MKQNRRLFLSGYSVRGFSANQTQRVTEESFADLLPLTAMVPGRDVWFGTNLGISKYSGESTHPADSSLIRA